MVFRVCPYIRKEFVASKGTLGGLQHSLECYVQLAYLREWHFGYFAIDVTYIAPDASHYSNGIPIPPKVPGPARTKMMAF